MVYALVIQTLPAFYQAQIFLLANLFSPACSIGRDEHSIIIFYGQGLMVGPASESCGCALDILCQYSTVVTGGCPSDGVA